MLFLFLYPVLTYSQVWKFMFLILSHTLKPLAKFLLTGGIKWNLFCIFFEFLVYIGPVILKQPGKEPKCGELKWP